MHGETETFAESESAEVILNALELRDKGTGESIGYEPPSLMNHGQGVLHINQTHFQTGEITAVKLGFTETSNVEHETFYIIKSVKDLLRRH
jgi:hypothetical protein